MFNYLNTLMIQQGTLFVNASEECYLYTGLFKEKYTLSKIYFTRTIEHMAKCYI
jgi:hypothetical protein